MCAKMTAQCICTSIVYNHYGSFPLHDIYPHYMFFSKQINIQFHQRE